MELIERSVKDPGYQAGTGSVINLRDQLKNTIQESLKSEPIEATAAVEEQNAENSAEVNPEVTAEVGANHEGEDDAIDEAAAKEDANKTPETTNDANMNLPKTQSETKEEEKATPSAQQVSISPVSTILNFS